MDTCRLLAPMSLEIFQEMDRSKAETEILFRSSSIKSHSKALYPMTLHQQVCEGTDLFDFARFGQTGAVTLSDFEAYLAGDEL